MSQFVIRDVILSYPELFEMKAIKGNDNSRECYSCTVLIPKTNTAAVQQVQQAMQEVFGAAQADKLKGYSYEHIKKAFYDGDGVRNSGKEFGEECKGHWVLTAKSYNYAPGVVDEHCNPVMDKSKVYSGVVANVDLSCYAYKAPTAAGLTFGLSNVQVLGKGERIGATVRSATEAFGAPTPNMADMAGTTVQYDPQTGQPIYK